MKPGTKVCLLTFSFSRPGVDDWSTTGVILRNRKGAAAPDGWHIVRFDDSGGALCVHASRLRVQS